MSTRSEGRRHRVVHVNVGKFVPCRVVELSDVKTCKESKIVNKKRESLTRADHERTYGQRHFHRKRSSDLQKHRREELVVSESQSSGLNERGNILTDGV